MIPVASHAKSPITARQPRVSGIRPSSLPDLSTVLGHRGSHRSSSGCWPTGLTASAFGIRPIGAIQLLDAGAS